MGKNVESRGRKEESGEQHVRDTNNRGLQLNGQERFNPLMFLVFKSSIRFS